MNRLEEFINNHKNLFDEEPEAGHFERLQEKMNRETLRDAARHVSTVKILWRGLSIAASIAIVFSVWQYASRQNVILVCENAIDMKICYLDRMEAVANQIEALISDFDQWDRQDVMNDVQNIIDAVNSDFEIEIPEELPEDIAKTIIADYYRQNLESLKMIAESINN
jgi:hypothetical protein